MTTNNLGELECLDYALPAHRLAGTRTEVLRQLDEIIVGLVGLRQMISSETKTTPEARKPRLRLVSSLTIGADLLSLLVRNIENR